MAVGYVYDSVHLEHDTGSHEENGGRLLAVMQHLEETGLLADLEELPAGPATMDEVILVHSRSYVAMLEQFLLKGAGWITPDTVMAHGSLRAAFAAAGGTIAAVEAVVSGQVRSAFALVRPPGHHARPAQAMGFCFFNNIALAVRRALCAHKLARVLIVDFDVHHGNGTQEVFYDDPRVLYFSVHESPLFPMTGLVEEIGSGEGRGSTINVPLPAYCGDQEYDRVFAEILVPAARRFQPQLIVVSAGYDTHWADPLALMLVSNAGFASQVRAIRDLAAELCDGKVAITLEGGYDYAALANGVKATFDVLLKREVPTGDPLGLPPRAGQAPRLGDLIAEVRAMHRL